MVEQGMTYWLAVSGLGVAGLDPLGALLLGALLAGGTRRTGAFLVCLSNFVTTVFVGVIGVHLLNPVVHLVLGVAEQVHDLWWALAEVVAGLVCIIWTIVRFRRGHRAAPKERAPRTVPVWMLPVIGAAYGLASYSDPTFYGFLAVSSHQSLSVVVVGLTLWFLLTQSPMLVLAAVSGTRRVAVVLAYVTSGFARLRRPVAIAITLFGALAGLYLLLDSLAWFTTGTFIV